MQSGLRRMRAILKLGILNSVATCLSTHALCASAGMQAGSLMLGASGSNMRRVREHMCRTGRSLLCRSIIRCYQSDSGSGMTRTRTPHILVATVSRQEFMQVARCLTPQCSFLVAGIHAGRCRLSVELLQAARRGASVAAKSPS